ncbi:MAG TPA: hypothetical protein VFV67_00135 [Actinophytocola sp.]|uniref:hypothetical protein n=1 Tax=Actinophytocola sp. TaxID=1872138 RepID=UPI002DB7E8FD|nr:hypothetical protein [Actinophytocola sp.]HEU5469031.1 hypothetical protein [Actinophytocola sp.]
MSTMDECAVRADAYHLLQQDIYRHLEEAEYVAEDLLEDDEDSIELGSMLLVELSAMIRGMLGLHRTTPTGTCRTCGGPWPCHVVGTIYTMVKDPQRPFVELMRRSAAESE